MQPFAWRVDEILRKLGVKFRGAQDIELSDFVQPVLVVGDVAALGGQPKRRYTPISLAATAGGTHSTVAICSPSLDLELFVVNNSSSLLAMAILPPPQNINPATFGVVPSASSYFPPGQPFLNDTNLQFGTTVAAFPFPGSTPAGFINPNDTTPLMRLAPGVLLVIQNSTIATGFFASMFVEQSVAFENRP